MIPVRENSEVVIIYTEISNILEGWIQYLGVAYPLFSILSEERKCRHVKHITVSASDMSVADVSMVVDSIPTLCQTGCVSMVAFEISLPTGFDGQSPLCIPTGMHMHSAIKSPHTLAIHVQVLCGLQRVVSSHPCTFSYVIYSSSRSELLRFEACFQSYSAGNLPSCLSANFGSSVL